MIKSIYPIPAFSDNYIWIICDEDSNSACVVDPGDAAPVLEYLDHHQLTLSDILITHHHPDHTGGLKQLISRFSPRVIGPKPSEIPGISQHVFEGDRIELFGSSFEVLEVPGHTLDHIAFYSDSDLNNSPVLFCGDTLFAAGCGRLFEGTTEMMTSSLSKLAALRGDTRVYCAHEYTISNLKFACAGDPDNEDLVVRIAIERRKQESNQPTLPSNINLELQTNPFLRCDRAALIKNAESTLGKKMHSSTEVFAALRNWKDRF